MQLDTTAGHEVLAVDYLRKVLESEGIPTQTFALDPNSPNLVARMTPGIDTLRPEEYVAGALVLRRKIKRFKPPIVALIGVSIYRSLFKVRQAERVTLGLQKATLEGSRVFVLPNPSGRNANFSYEEMLAAFRTLRRTSARLRLR